jgi:hypothetical protein
MRLILVCVRCCAGIFFAVTWIDRISTLSVYSRSNDHPALGILGNDHGRRRQEGEAPHQPQKLFGKDRNYESDSRSDDYSSRILGSSGRRWRPVVVPKCRNVAAQVTGGTIRWCCRRWRRWEDPASKPLHCALWLSELTTCPLLHCIPYVSHSMHFSPQ